MAGWTFLTTYLSGDHSVLSALFQIVLLAICIYVLLRVFRHTPSIYVFSGLIGLALLLAILTHLFRSTVLGTLCWYLLKGFPLATLIILQEDLRRLFLQVSTMLTPRGLAVMRHRRQYRRNREAAIRIDALVKAICCLTTQPAWRKHLQNYDDELSLTPHLAKRDIGALIAIQGTQGLLPIIERGVPLESRFDPEHPTSFTLLLLTIFHPGSPLHDGGVILSSQFRILAAGCLFPQSLASDHSPIHTRHNAALGLSKNTDSLVLVVSEESGNVSVASQGTLRRLHSPEDLAQLLGSLLNPTAQTAADAPQPAKP